MDLPKGVSIVKVVAMIKFISSLPERFFLLTAFAVTLPFLLLAAVAFLPFLEWDDEMEDYD